jgi:hypothetical protein
MWCLIVSFRVVNLLLIFVIRKRIREAHIEKQSVEKIITDHLNLLFGKSSASSFFWRFYIKVYSIVKFKFHFHFAHIVSNYLIFFVKYWYCFWLIDLLIDWIELNFCLFVVFKSNEFPDTNRIQIWKIFICSDTRWIVTWSWSSFSNQKLWTSLGISPFTTIFHVRTCAHCLNSSINSSFSSFSGSERSDWNWIQPWLFGIFEALNFSFVLTLLITFLISLSFLQKRITIESTFDAPNPFKVEDIVGFIPKTKDLFHPEFLDFLTRIEFLFIFHFLFSFFFIFFSSFEINILTIYSSTNDISFMFTSKEKLLKDDQTFEERLEKFKLLFGDRSPQVSLIHVF